MEWGRGHQAFPSPIQRGKICPSCPYPAQDVLQRRLADQPFPTLTREKGNLSVKILPLILKSRVPVGRGWDAS